ASRTPRLNLTVDQPTPGSFARWRPSSRVVNDAKRHDIPRGSAPHRGGDLHPRCGPVRRVGGRREQAPRHRKLAVIMAPGPGHSTVAEMMRARSSSLSGTAETADGQHHASLVAGYRRRLHLMGIGPGVSVARGLPPALVTLAQDSPVAV